MKRYGLGTIGSDPALQAEGAVERHVWPHLDDAIAIAHHHSGAGAGAGTNTNGVEGVEVEVDGRPRENGEVDVEVKGGLGYHVVIVSHGPCISEMVAAILRWSANAGATTKVRFKGLVNTGWTRVRIRPMVSDRWSFLMHCD